MNRTVYDIYDCTSAKFISFYCMAHSCVEGCDYTHPAEKFCTVIRSYIPWKLHLQKDDIKIGCVYCLGDGCSRAGNTLSLSQCNVLLITLLNVYIGLTMANLL